MVCAAFSEGLRQVSFLKLRSTVVTLKRQQEDSQQHAVESSAVSLFSASVHENMISPEAGHAGPSRRQRPRVIGAMTMVGLMFWETS